MLCLTVRLLTPAENCTVNDDFLPEGNVFETECIKKIFLLSITLPGNSHCDKAQDQPVLHHEADTETAAVDHLVQF